MHDKTPAGIDPETGEILPVGATGAAPGAGATRPPGEPAEGSPRLDKRTYLNREQGHYRANLIDYGGGMVEVGWSFIPNRNPFKASGRGLSEDRAKNEDRAVRRARSTIRRKILAFGLDHLLTLTYRANVTDFTQTNADLSRFVRLVKKRRPDFHYVAVPELQERGAWHWHLAVKGRQDVDLLRTIWRKVVVEGNIDVQEPKVKGSRRLAMAKYLGKYLAKGFELKLRELNGHRFRASLGMNVPIEHLPMPPKEERGSVSAYVLGKLFERSGDIGFAWINEHGSVGWACSWK